MTSTTVMSMSVRARSRWTDPARARLRRRRYSLGHTLIEALLVVGIMAVILTIAAPRMIGWLGRSAVDEDVGRFVRTLQTTAQEAIYRGRRLAVVIEVLDGYYTVYEANSEDRYEQDLEPLIERQGLDECYIENIEFADGSQQFSGELVLHAAAQGWESSWLLTLIDLDEQLRWVRCDRGTIRVISDRQPLALPEPRTSVSISSPL